MTAFSSDVSVAIEVGFGHGPYETSPTWTDITDDVRIAHIRRGRGHSLDRVSASTCRLTVDNASGAYDPLYGSGVKPMAPIRVRATHSATTYDLFYGMIRRWPMTWPGRGKDAVVNLESSDALGLIALTNTMAAESQEASGVRIGNLLDSASFPASWRNLATGDVTVAAYQPDCASILSLIRQVEDTEAGLAFIAGNGDFTFQAQSDRVGAVSSATFGDSGSDIRYEEATLVEDDDQIWNRVEVSRVGGATVANEDTISMSAYGERLLTRFDTLHTSDGEASSLASALLARYKDPHVVLTRLDVNPARSDAWADVLDLELSDLITVKKSLSYASHSVTQYVESIETTIHPRERTWRTVLVGTQYE